GGAGRGAGGPNAPRTVEEGLARLHQARRRGYVVVNEEFEAGHVAAAAPVRDFGGRVTAALNISAPKFRLGRSLPAAAREIKAAADHLGPPLRAGPAAATPRWAGGGRWRGRRG